MQVGMLFDHHLNVIKQLFVKDGEFRHRHLYSVAFQTNEGLSQYIFTTIKEVQNAATKWLWTYNNERPNMATGGITPKQKLAMMSIAA